MKTKKERILSDIVKANKEYQIKTSTDNFISRDLYMNYGEYSIHQIVKYFDNWSNASEEAKKLFELARKEKVTDEEWQNEFNRDEFQKIGVAAFKQAVVEEKDGKTIV